MINRIGILGGTGFVGKNITNRFRKLGIECDAVSRSTGVDARNADDVYNWLKRYKPDAVVNLAAECGGIGRNQRIPADLWLSTTLISGAVLAGCQRYGEARLVMVGSVCSYPAECPIPFKEEYLMSYGPPEPTNRAYGLAKLNALYGAQAFEQQYGLPVCNLIVENMYGPHDHYSLEDSHVIPALIRKMILGRAHGTVELWGTGRPTREFLYAEDLADAILVVITKPDIGSGFINVGSGADISIAALAELIADLTGFVGDIIWDASMPDGQMKRCLDLSKISDLGFEAATGLREGLQKTMASLELFGPWPV